MLRGSLWKWTNYWNGWQLRWFILDNGGTLSYFKSQEEENEGCKGSLNVSSCEIRVHPTDLLRLDISISGEQYIYLRANSEKERQEWLVGLGSVKACVQKSDSTRRCSEDIMTKRSELKLYCDLLMQQVHTIKSAINTDKSVDVEKLTTGSSLLVETCDTFIRTLDKTMALSDSSCNIITGISSHKDCNMINLSPHRRIHPQKNSVSGINGDISHLDYSKRGGDRKNSDESHRAKLETILLNLKNPFQEVDISPTHEIPTKMFLKSSESAIVICDFLNKSAFKPLKEDMINHIQCLRSNYRINPTSHQYIQSMINEEIKIHGSWQNSPSSQSLYWLARGLIFIHNFLRHMMESDDTVEDSLTIAYETALKNYKGGRMETVYKDSLKNCPSREEFLVLLGLPEETSNTESRKKIFQPKLFLSLAKYLYSMEKCLMILIQFCDIHLQKVINAPNSTNTS
ncbi:pleckstrin homology domain-containing family A member 8 isoform X2 [Lepeophtheirus salmonis]|uniref:pleckstrin homology domain-containing family A member 8 isoform X2 n=1 Tax=Lepeophtheirus salmonis TaxID=72036 RepID=UPI001AE3A456|nr:oxysterol-binding protein-related protein 1C-like isoform X2 [Lepeophtheirus salmonis]